MNRDRLAPPSAASEALTVYRVHPAYGWLGTGLLGLGCLLGWNFVGDRDTGTLIMAVLCLVLAGMHLQWLGACLTCTAAGVTWQRPGHGLRAIRWHEIRDVQLAGRVTRYVQIAYAGDDVEWLSLPRMRDQERLYRQVCLGLGLPAADG